MADFLNRLAGRALGVIPLAEPVIPARFNPGTESTVSFASESAFQPTRPFPETSPESPSEFSEDRARPLRRRVDHPGFEASVDRIASSFHELDEAPRRPLPQRSSAVLPQYPQPLHRNRETVSPSPERVQIQRPHPASPMNPPDDAVERTATHRPPATSPEPVPFSEPLSFPRRAPLAEPMRSPAAQHPEPSLALRPAAPTIRVSIGRIEVRAEIASPQPTAPAQRRTRPSTLSLGEFLKQAGSGR